MKKAFLAGAIALSLSTVATSAQALEIDVTAMNFGSLSVASGTIDSVSMGDVFTGMFFTQPWTATTQAFYSDVNAPLTWSGSSGQGAYSYNFTLTGTQIAFGVFWDWTVNYEIPVLVIMDCGSHNPVPGDICTGTGTPMQVGPFPGQAPAFNGVVVSNNPIFTSNNVVSVDENILATGYTAAAVYEANDVFTYSIVGGDDQNRFFIHSTRGYLFFNSTPDFETPTDVGEDNTYELIVEADDGAGNTATQEVSITVLDVEPEDLHFTDYLTADIVDFIEGEMGNVYDADAVTPNGSAVTYSLDGVDAAEFNIVENTGVITFINSPNQDVKSTYQVNIIASDGVDPDVSLSLTINILDSNQPPVITLIGSSNIYVQTGDVFVDFGATANDSEDGDLTASIITNSNVDVSTAGDYTVIYSVTDTSGVTTAVTRNVNVTSATHPFKIGMTSMDFGEISAVSGTIDRTSMGDTFTGLFFGEIWTSKTQSFYAEGSGAHTWAGTTSQGNYSYAFNLTGTQIAYGIYFDWSVNAGIPVLMIMDCGNVNPLPGAVCTGTGTPMQVGPFPGQAPSFNGVVIYEEAAFISNNVVSTEENLFATGYTAVAVHSSNNIFSYSISDGIDQHLFNINNTTGVLSFISAPDFEMPADANANNVYEISIMANDGLGHSVTQEVTVTVIDVVSESLHFNDYIISDSVAYAENETVEVYDAGAITSNAVAVTFSLSGTDASYFGIDTTTGVVTFISPPDYETKTSYVINIIASDGIDPDVTLTLTINIQDLNDESPIFSSVMTASIEESSYDIIYTAVVNDLDTALGDIVFSLSGDDARMFNLHQNIGQGADLNFYYRSNYEYPSDTNGDNNYEVIITADDGVNTTDLSLTITVTDVNEAPVITINKSSYSSNLLVNETYIDTGATAVDPEDGSLTSSIVTTSTVDTSTVGNYTVTYSVTDSDGITTTATRDVAVRVSILTIDMTEMFFGELTPITGQISSSQLGTYFEGVFFGAGFTVSTQVFFDIGSGAQTWSGDSPQGAFEYNFTLTGTQFAFGGYMDWQTSSAPPVLMIMDCGSVNPIVGDVCTGIGTPMQTGPFPGQAPSFNGVAVQRSNNLPYMTLNGEELIRLQQGDTYIDTGALAVDVEDGQLTQTIVVDNPVDTSVAGTYSVTYSVTDFSGDTSTITRLVMVVAQSVAYDVLGGTFTLEYAEGTTRDTVYINGDGSIDLDVGRMMDGTFTADFACDDYGESEYRVLECQRSNYYSGPNITASKTGLSTFSLYDGGVPYFTFFAATGVDSPVTNFPETNHTFPVIDLAAGTADMSSFHMSVDYRQFNQGSLDPVNPAKISGGGMIDTFSTNGIVTDNFDGTYTVSWSSMFVTRDRYEFDGDIGHWAMIIRPLDTDDDNDGVLQSSDNCTEVANPDQLDTDGDGFGNVCDADLNNDNIVNAMDLGMFRQRYFSTDADADFNGDGIVNAMDLAKMRNLYAKPPGPSGLVP